jgi:hypothetical protein
MGNHKDQTTKPQRQQHGELHAFSHFGEMA